ncbi:glutamate--tRNA ligase [Arcobacter sp. s6]|uniref:glutamate--tRNA ligase n=1 Tax=Arcobacter sp. s6 TaxID=3230363 RepID=UPI0034A01758
MLRFAPSPIEDFNIGNLRVAIFNYIVSKQLNEDLVIRIEDIDVENIIEGKDKEIIELLNLFSIEYRNIVYQSDSLKYHQKIALQLMSQKKAFACFCSDDKLDELKQEAQVEGKIFSYDGFCETLSDETVLNTNAPFRIRIRKPDENIKFTDVLKGNLDYSPLEVDSFPILNQDKKPTYNYACAVDDMIMDISMVIRNENHISNTAKQIHVRNSLGYTKEVKYVHLLTILNAQTNKNISKEDNINSVKWLIDEGFLPSAIANYLVLLGNKTPKEIFSLEEAISWFKLEDISKEPAKFDINELKLINKKHLETIDDMRLSKILGFADNDIGKLAKLYLKDVSTIKELKEIIAAIFTEKTSSEDIKKEFGLVKKSLQKAPFFDNLAELEKYIEQETNLKNNDLSKVLKYILIGTHNGPNISDIYPLIKNYLGEIVK